MSIFCLLLLSAFFLFHLRYFPAILLGKWGKDVESGRIQYVAVAYGEMRYEAVAYGNKL